ncbi:MAG: hypothetical protein Q8Q65_01695, partial [bacterium]|nr:hypothetical protein [bacterium]
LGMILVIAGLILGGGWWFLSSIGNGLSSIGKYEGQTAEEWFNEYNAASAQIDALNTRIEDFQYALQDANDNIEEANSNIESAKNYSGGSYDEMDYALYSLDTVSTIAEP